tara:strand:+ start:299 stop:589 length:291 start_codon:yes stop_codon:yes gene_type:complete
LHLPKGLRRPLLRPRLLHLLGLLHLRVELLTLHLRLLCQHRVPSLLPHLLGLLEAHKATKATKALLRPHRPRLTHRTLLHHLLSQATTMPKTFNHI